MTRYLLKRILVLAPVALGVATITFALIHLVPGDPVVAMLGDEAQPADIAGMRHELGLDRPLWRQYLAYLGGIARGDLGESLSMRQPVGRLMAERYPATLARAGLHDESTLAERAGGKTGEEILGGVLGWTPRQPTTREACRFALGVLPSRLDAEPKLVRHDAKIFRWCS